VTPYNLAASIGRALDAGAVHLLDPGADGTVTVAPKGIAILVLESAGERTLQTATGVDLGTSVKVYATAASATVNSQAIADGGYAEFQVTLNASGVNQWSLVSLLPAAVADLGTVVITTGDPGTDDALVALAAALEALGLVAQDWSAAP
jgi:hypothetical protein